MAQKCTYQSVRNEEIIIIYFVPYIHHLLCMYINIKRCPCCRNPFETPSLVKKTATGSYADSGEGYVNLADVAGISPVRDTSTYYSRRNW